MCHIWFIHSSVDRHLGCFHLLASVSNVALNIGIQISGSLFSVLWDIYLEVELLGHGVILCLKILRNHHTV